jgi:hypothetical protein
MQKQIFLGIFFLSFFFSILHIEVILKEETSVGPVSTFGQYQSRPGMGSNADFCPGMSQV